ncbi:hypothetical protein MLD38_007625 [Melastoma candidum]|uniref:Uncharacterized protein n=1 Tax=Melastoma candidum TaxID=119954 RepID=A0ACB9RRU7_9MYRT|nr:hypothetical protein MLD38_007625 [Melastoma candidum]
MKPNSLDYWREYFRPSNHDIFDIVDGAIMVAASDRPQEFKLRRDLISERLFSSCRDTAVNRETTYGHREAEALADKVSRIKEILINSQEESVLLESLGRLQSMEITVAMLKGTGIGITVNLLRKHQSKQISQLALALISLWKSMVDEWMQTTQDNPAHLIGGTPDSMNTSTVVDEEEEGLPIPPLDEGAFLAVELTPVELSRFFDGMDDDGNPNNSTELPNQCGNGRKSSLQTPNRNGIHQQIRERPNETKDLGRNDKPEPLRKETLAVKPNRVPNDNSERERHADPSAERKIDKEMKLQPRRLEKPTIITQGRFLGNQQNDSKCTDEEAATPRWLEAVKRKMQEQYRELENAKKRRTIKVLELPHLPKQGARVNRWNPTARPGNQKKQWVNGRR